MTCLSAPAQTLHQYTAEGWRQGSSHTLFCIQFLMETLEIDANAFKWKLKVSTEVLVTQKWYQSAHQSIIVVS